MFFVKLIKILTGIFVFWLIFRSLHQLGRRNRTARTIKQGDNSHTRRKFVESRVVERSSQTDDEAQSFVSSQEVK